jgi:ankyrin repeat protein
MTTAAIFGLAWLADARAAKLDQSFLSAVLANDSERVRALSDAGVSPNSKYGPSKTTPLHIAAQRGHAEMVCILMDAGAHIDAVDSRRLRPLDGCVNSWMTTDADDVGYAATVATLVDHGATLTAIATREHPSRTDQSELDARLGEAAERGRGLFVDFLLSSGADPNATDLSGATPLARCIAARHDRDTTLSVITPLLKAGADPNLTGVRWSPLHDAVEQGNVDMVRCLLEHGADSARRRMRSTPLDIATSQGHTEMIELLQAYGK